MRLSPMWSLLMLLLATKGDYFAKATFTVGATDKLTGQVGAAGCTCVMGRPSLYDRVHHPVPGKGLLISQAMPPDPATPSGEAVYETAREMLERGEDPADIIRTITDPTLDTGVVTNDPAVLLGDIIDNTTLPDADDADDIWEYPNNEVRQYGSVDLQGRAAGYTGASIKPFYFSEGDDEIKLQRYTQEDIQGTAGGSFTYSAQGNIVSYATVTTLSRTFESAGDGGGCGDDLADRLFRAVVAVDDANTEANENTSDEDFNFEGDVRCEGSNVPCHQGYLHVDNADGTVHVHIEWVAEMNIPADVFDNVTYDNSTDIKELLDELLGPYRINQTVNPFDDMRIQYDAWRDANPCPSAAAETTTSSAPASNPWLWSSLYLGSLLSLAVAFVA